MGLLDKNPEYLKDEFEEKGADVFIKDCVGKVGQCNYVTDLKTGETLRDTMLYRDDQKIEQPIINKETLDDEYTAKAFLAIMKKLDVIIKILS